MQRKTQDTSPHGVIVPLATPLAAQDQLDVPGLLRLVEYVLAGGVHGLFILGTNGEGPSLSVRLRRAVVEHVCTAVDNRVPVYVSVSDTAPAESLIAADHAANKGATAVVLTAPWYFPMQQPEYLHYLQTMAAAISLPVLAYNIPAMTGIPLDVATFRQILSIENIVGLKDSSGDFAYFQELLTVVGDRKGFSMLVGSEGLLGEAVHAGAQGGVCGGANFHPKLFVDMYTATMRGDAQHTQGLQEDIRFIQREIYDLPGAGTPTMKGIKCALGCLGICADTMASPLTPFLPKHRHSVRNAITHLGLLPADA